MMMMIEESCSLKQADHGAKACLVAGDGDWDDIIVDGAHAPCAASQGSGPDLLARGHAVV